MQSILDITEMAAEIGIDDAEAARRKAFLELTAADEQLLLEARGPLLSHQNAFVESFYAHLDGFAEVRALLPEGQRREALMRTQTEYFNLLTSGDYGFDYVLNRLGVGLSHQRAGLEPKWYIGAYRKYLCSLLPLLYRHFGENEEKLLPMFEAFLKVMFFDMGLAIDTYIHADKQTIFHLEKHIRGLVQGIDAIIWEVDVDAARYTFVSDQSLIMLGYQPQQWLDDPHFWRDIILEEDRQSTVSYRLAETAAGRDHELDYRVRAAEGRIVWVRERINIVRNREGKVSALRGFMLDITQHRQAENKLTYCATHDELTNLPNRTLLQDRTNQGIAHVSRQGGLLALMLVDLDRFRNINDSLGHHIGDSVLRTAAGRLMGCVRDVDTVARLGGDEFIILLNGISRMDDISRISRKILAALERPFHIDGHELTVTASIGISVYPKDGHDVQSLLKNADTAMYRAKDLGKNRAQFFAGEMNAVAVQRLFVESQLQQALKRGEFVVYYQPKVDTESGQICGAEALVRWNHPQKGLIPPGEFIPIAEETGVIVKLGKWVMETACRQAVDWQRTGFPKLRIAVNLSARQLVYDGLAESIERILSGVGMHPSLLELELTESMLIQNAETSAATLNRLRRLGVHLSLDDFGTGYSALGYLNRFPLTSVKIDRSFVADITTDAHATALARSIISMAHELRMRVVAEGVETEGQLRFLASRHCDEVQGYYVSRPLQAEEFGKLLREFGGLKLNSARVTDDRKRTLLVVDNDPNVIAGLRRLLDPDGYHVLSASTGREGLELLATSHAAVIISNQSMPGMSGEDFLGRVKEIYPQTMRIMLSESTEWMAVANAINHGAIHKFLSKPWQDDLLRADIDEAFRHYELEQKNRALTLEIERANQELSEINRALEQRVDERTCNLEQSIEVLKISQEIIEQLPVAVIGVDETGLIVMVNQAAEEMFSTEADIPLSGTMAMDRLPSPLVECLNETLERGPCSRQLVVLPHNKTVHAICRRLGKHCRSKGILLAITPVE